ncbi:hypothetical protein AB0N07_02125 [Streptomyces sp. NPDC051172]|uniref:hypothetical protein n=1 Tax=Streptomyces sp. NPDC051172 TaxID=3155796 RepID=UPI00342581E3
MRPFFVETNDNAPQDSTDAYSGVLPTSGGYGPVAPATATTRATASQAAQPHRVIR